MEVQGDYLKNSKDHVNVTRWIKATRKEFPATMWSVEYLTSTYKEDENRPLESN